jgi:serine/threonine protein kinase
MEKLCADGGHENIVKILRHGWFSDQSYFYIDMELCDHNLEDHILKDKAWSSLVSGSSSLGAGQSADELLNRKFQEIMDIITQIIRGIEFIHSRNAVHRDLKPRNGSSRRSLLTL